MNNINRNHEVGFSATTFHQKLNFNPKLMSLNTNTPLQPETGHSHLMHNFNIRH